MRGLRAPPVPASSTSTSRTPSSPASSTTTSATSPTSPPPARPALPPRPLLTRGQPTPPGPPGPTRSARFCTTHDFRAACAQVCSRAGQRGRGSRRRDADGIGGGRRRREAEQGRGERRGGGGAGRRYDGEEEEEEGQTGVAWQAAARGQARGVGGPMTAADSRSCSAFPWEVATEKRGRRRVAAEGGLTSAGGGASGQVVRTARASP